MPFKSGFVLVTFVHSVKPLPHHKSFSTLILEANNRLEIEFAS
jgi:hypothetical protein